MKTQLILTLTLISASALAAEGCRGDAALACKNADLNDKTVQLCLYPWTAEVVYDGGEAHVYENLVLSNQDQQGVAYSATGFGIRVNTADEPTIDGYAADFSASDLGRANLALRCQPL